MTNLMFRSLPNNEVDDVLQYGMEMAGGPLYGILQRGSRSLNLMREGNYARGLEGMIPAGFSGPLRSIRYATEGALHSVVIQLPKTYLLYLSLDSSLDLPQPVILSS